MNSGIWRTKTLVFLLLFSFLLCSGLVPLRGAEDLNRLLEEGDIPKRILVLFDTSYSMGVRFPGSGASYRDEGISSFEDFIREMKGDPYEWALAMFSKRGSFDLQEDFGASSDEILQRVRDTESWDATDISGSVEEAVDYLSGNGGGVLLLISDLLETEGELFSLPHLNNMGEKGVVVLVTPSPLSPNLVFHDQLDRWVGGQENLFFYDGKLLEGNGPPKPNPLKTDSPKPDPLKPDPPEVDSLEVESTETTSPETADTGGTVYSRSTRERKGLSLSFFRLRRQAVEPFVGIVVLFILILCVFMSTVSFRMVFRRNQDLAPSFRHRLHYFRAYKKEILEERILKFPLNENNTVFLLPEDNRCEIFLESDKIFLKCEKSVMVDGVGGRSKRIKNGSILRAGSHRFFIGKLETEEIVPKPEKLPLKHEYGYLVFLLASAISMFLFTLGSIAIPPDAEITRASKWVPVEVSPPEAIRPYREKNREKPEAFEPEISIAVTEKRGPKTAPAVINLDKGGTSEEWKSLPERGSIDVLFLHAHPDDEAIDFGGLLAKLSQRGKRTGVVLFTDGESGLSRGPYRNQTLSPPVFSSIRVEEATASMTELGCDLYVRLGYRNHPYSRASHVMSLPQVYRAWGGKPEVLERTLGLIERIAPKVVVSIDGHSRTLIHFEHEAVGNIVTEALEELERRGTSTIEGYLLAINPLHSREYPEAVSIPVIESVEPEVESPRSLQSEALKQHASQIDAGVIAIEYMPFFPDKRVKRVFWNLEEEIEEYF